MLEPQGDTLCGGTHRSSGDTVDRYDSSSCCGVVEGLTACPLATVDGVLGEVVVARLRIVAVRKDILASLAALRLVGTDDDTVGGHRSCRVGIDDADAGHDVVSHGIACIVVPDTWLGELSPVAAASR